MASLIIHSGSAIVTGELPLTKISSSSEFTKSSFSEPGLASTFNAQDKSPLLPSLSFPLISNDHNMESISPSITISDISADMKDIPSLLSNVIQSTLQDSTLTTGFQGVGSIVTTPSSVSWNVDETSTVLPMASTSQTSVSTPNSFLIPQLDSGSTPLIINGISTSDFVPTKFQDTITKENMKSATTTTLGLGSSSSVLMVNRTLPIPSPNQSISVGETVNSSALTDPLIILKSTLEIALTPLVFPASIVSYASQQDTSMLSPSRSTFGRSTSTSAGTETKTSITEPTTTTGQEQNKFPTSTRYILGFGIPLVAFVLLISLLLIWLIRLKAKEGVSSKDSRSEPSALRDREPKEASSEGASTPVEDFNRTRGHTLSPHGVLVNTSQATDGFADGEYDNPRIWPIGKKVWIACFALLAAFVATFGTPIYVTAIPDIARIFFLNSTAAISPASFYPFGLGVGALIGTAACEIWGRSIVYRVASPIVFTFVVVGGTARSFAVIAVSRIMAGLFAGPFITVGVGILNDMWDVSLEKTGTAFAVLFIMVIIWATQVGPMVSAAVISFGWQWTFWTNAIAIGLTVLLAFNIPETYGPQIRRKAALRRNKPLPPRGTSLTIFLIAVGRPLNMLIFEPIVFPTGLVMAVTQSVVFTYYVEYAILFEKVYGFTQYQVGMAFSPLVIGSLFALPIVGFCDRVLYQPSRAEAIRLGTTVPPEKRLYPAMVGSILLPISLFWLAWTGRKDISWIVPVLSGGLFGTAYVLNLMCLPIYNNDVYAAKYGASVQAASTFMRFSISAAFPLFTAQMVEKVGFTWATSILGFVTVALIPVPWVFFKWGPALRQRGKYLMDNH